MSVPEFTEPASVLPVCLEVTEVSGAKAVWRVELFPDRLTLSSNENPDPLVFPRVDLANKIQYVDGMGFFIVKFPREIQLRLKPQDVSTFWKWWSPPTPENLQRVLKQKLGHALPVGILLLFLAFPDVGSLSSRIVTGVLGLLMIGMWAITKLRPYPIIFVIDALWFLTLSGSLIFRIVEGGSWLWLLLILFNCWLAVRDFKTYQHFSQQS